MPRVLVGGRGSYTMTPEHKGLLKDTVDFRQYKSDSGGARPYLMILPRKKKYVIPICYSVAGLLELHIRCSRSSIFIRQQRVLIRLNNSFYHVIPLYVIV